MIRAISYGGATSLGMLCEQGLFSLFAARILYATGTASNVYRFHAVSKPVGFGATQDRLKVMPHNPGTFREPGHSDWGNGL